MSFRFECWSIVVGQTQQISVNQKRGLFVYHVLGEAGINSRTARSATMNISGVSSAHGSVSVSGVQGVEATDAAMKTQAEGLSEVHDNISVSVDAVQAAETVSDVRLDRVNSIRSAIADGTYETAEKLDVAIDRLLDRLS